MLDVKKDREFTSKIDDKIREVRGEFERHGMGMSILDNFRGSMAHYKDRMADPISNVDEPLYLQLEKY